MESRLQRCISPYICANANTMQLANRRNIPLTHFTSRDKKEIEHTQFSGAMKKHRKMSHAITIDFPNKPDTYTYV